LLLFIRAHRTRGALALVAIVLIALGFRLWRIESVPPGLYIDEVHAARSVLQWRSDPHASWLGSRPLVRKGWVETTNLYLAAASAMMTLGGDSILGIRLVSVIPSLFCVALLYWLGCEVGGRRTGLLAAFLLAVSHWAARTGRTGWVQVLMMALQLAALAWLARAHRRDANHEGAAIGAGAAIGLSLYTYVASRLVLAHALVWQAWEVLVTKPRRNAMRRLVLLAASALVIAGPFYFFLMRDHSDQLNLRAREVSVLGRPDPWATLGENIAGHLLMFHVRGAAYARDAYPRFPMLDPITGVLLLCGCVAVWHIGGWQRRMLVSWFAISILAGVLSVSPEGPPYTFRVANLAPWACLVAAMGGVWLWDRLASRVRIAQALAALVLTVVLAINYWVVFVAGAAYPGNLRVYGVAPTQIGRWLAASRQGRPALVHIDTLGPILVGDFPHARANSKDYFRVEDRVFALQYIAGDQTYVVGGEPATVPRNAIVIVPRRLAAVIHRLAPDARASIVRLEDGTELAIAFETH
jgi:4-amino-4-deoxy-L-arabinose transferase-like glycosyltransferase